MILGAKKNELRSEDRKQKEKRIEKIGWPASEESGLENNNT